MFETQRLVIENMTVDDFEPLKHILTDPVTMQFWPAPFSNEQVMNWINKNVTNYTEYGFGRWLIKLKTNNVIIGDCGFLVSDINDRIENDLGYIIYSKYWRQGYGLEAAQACLEHGFTRFNMKRIVANMPYDHYASIKVAEKLGMIKEKEFLNKRNRDILTFLYVKEV